MQRFFHSVILDKDKCLGCTNCIKRCPTEAIRVREGKARIISDRCIDCGECIRVCPHHAKKSNSDNLSIIHNYKYKIALIPPSLFLQFNNLSNIDIVLNGVKNLGFDMAFEVSRAAEIVSDATRKLINANKLKKPVISSACPVIVRLVRVRFKNLCENVLNINSPMQIAAMLAKRQAQKDFNIPAKDIGAFFLAPCPAKVSEAKSMMYKEKSYVDGVISISDIFGKLTYNMSKLKNIEKISHSGVMGLSWAKTGGESLALGNLRYLAADGIENVIKVLEEIEDEKIGGLDFIELNACFGGCVGGVLNVENPYVAKARLQQVKNGLNYRENYIDGEIPKDMFWTDTLKYSPVLNLSKDLNEAMDMMSRIDKICKDLPGLDCGSCGSPSCRALAEDTVKGHAKISDCIFILRKQVKKAADTLYSIDNLYTLDNKDSE